MTKEFDLVILGSGATAFAGALRAAELGKTAAMTEWRTLGGTCVNRGCLPSKNLIEAARIFYDSTHPRYPGLLRLFHHKEKLMKKKRSPSKKPPRGRKRAWPAAAIVVLALVLWAIRTSKHPPETEIPVRLAPNAGTETRVPPFKSSAEAAGNFPKALPAAGVQDPNAARAYRIAGAIPAVLVQQPCYCWCDKYGHGSLLDCFTTYHGAG